MLAVDGQQRRAARLRGTGHQLAGGDERFLVRQRDGPPGVDRRHHRVAGQRNRRSPPSPVGVAMTRLRSEHPRPPLPGSRFRPAAPEDPRKRVSSAITASFAPVRRATSASASALVARGERDDLESIRIALDEVERRRADRAGRAEDCDLACHASPTSCASGGKHSHRDQPVEPVEHAAMAGQPCSRILDPGPALHASFRTGRRPGRRPRETVQAQSKRDAEV